MERRALGRTGETLSAIAFGGIVLNKMAAAPASALVRDAFEGGVTHFDIAPSYGDAEEVLGPALASYRSRVFLSCKTLQRGRVGAAAAEEMKEKGRAVTPLFRTAHGDA